MKVEKKEKRKQKRRQKEKCLFHQANANICEKRIQNGGKEKEKKKGYKMEEKKIGKETK